MPKGKVYHIKDKRWFCPDCGHNKIKAVAAQTREDGCEMWFECEKCGYDPAGICDRVETVWGWEDELEVFALEVYRDCHLAGKKLIHKAFEEVQAKGKGE